ncbi:MAG: NADH-quinone oxidoreductase subunit M [Flavobacteriales bacterium]|nr:NADH-quinone oxidoreductase subunit M [Flavobacteriales bacterium]
MLTLALIVIPMLMAAAALIAGVKPARKVALASALVQLLLTLWAGWLWKSGQTGLLEFSQAWAPSLGMSFHLAIDGISLVLMLLSAIATPLILWTVPENKVRNPHLFYTLALLMIAGMNGAFMAMDGLLFYVFYELALIPIYFIILIWGSGENKGAVTLKFFLYTLFGSLFMLLALLFVYQHTTNGSFALTDLYAAGRSLPEWQQGLVFGGIFLAFAVKMPVFPFHTWQPSTYMAAPTAGTMLLAALMLKMATYGIIRLILPMVPDGVEAYKNWAIGFSVLSILYASLVAIWQRRYKLLIAYSSVAHVGLISAGLLTANVQAIQGGLFEMFSHGVIAIGLFFMTDILMSRIGHDDMYRMGGIRESNPQLAFLFFALVMGSVALPFTSGFVGEFLLLAGLAQHHVLYALAAGLTVILSAVYMLRGFQRMMLGPANSISVSFTALTMREKAMFAIVLLLVIGLGLFPNLLLSLSENSVQLLLK